MPKSEPKQAKRYFVRGIVQGVGFRYFVQTEARRLEIDGFVRNLDDGRVEVYAIATPPVHADLLSALHRGPRFADVRGVEEQESPMLKYEGFRIL